MIHGEKPEIAKLIQPAYFIYKKKNFLPCLPTSNVKAPYGNRFRRIRRNGRHCNNGRFARRNRRGIWDEDEEVEQQYRALPDGGYEINGDMDIDEMLSLFGMNENAIESDSVSVGGWVFETLGSIPEKGDSFQFGELCITVTEVTEQRITKLIVRRTVNQTETDKD